nr:MAG TPA_asm: hypothetical protein [Caudoviricetes sp.]
MLSNNTIAIISLSRVFNFFFTYRLSNLLRKIHQDVYRLFINRRSRYASGSIWAEL